MNLEANKILSLLPGCPWELRVVKEIDSTNSALKADLTAPHGTVLLTGHQTGGRGRMGRSFSSPEGGLYLSLLLLSEEKDDPLLHLTPMVAVALQRAIRDYCGVSVQIKWTNDLVAKGRKLGGILTELTVQENRRRIIIGIGLNCNTLPEEVGDMAISLAELTGSSVDLHRLAAAVILRLREMEAALFTEKDLWLQEYEAVCITVGKTVQVLQGETRRTAFALGIDENGGLRVRYESGETAVISTGEVSVRGMYGYL